MPARAPVRYSWTLGGVRLSVLARAIPATEFCVRIPQSLGRRNAGRGFPSRAFRPAEPASSDEKRQKVGSTCMSRGTASPRGQSMGRSIFTKSSEEMPPSEKESVLLGVMVIVSHRGHAFLQAKSQC